jgi:hypothetical protein
MPELWHTSVSRTSCAPQGDKSKWDLRLVESSFSNCTGDVWINDTERFQVRRT